MLLLGLGIGLALVCAAVPAILFVLNLRRYVAPRFGSTAGVRVAVLIPARNEEMNIGECLERVLASQEVELEVLVLDDDSSDKTVQIARAMADRDARLTLLRCADLPQGWNGKQHACWQMARKTKAELLLFLDADVRLDRWALARCVAGMQKREVALLSGFPRQVTKGFLEWMLLPLIHFILLGFLPMGRMRQTTDASLAAGCGQFLLVEREAYFACGGHAAMRETRHDGLRLPQLLRQNGYRTDLVDLTRLASVRMYRTGAEVWQGLAKNATEGMATPKRIVPFTLLLLLGQVVPSIAAVCVLMLMTSVELLGAKNDDPVLMALLYVAVGVALVCSYVPRLLAVRRFRQPLKSALLHPLGIVLLLTVQWYALTRQAFGKPVGWRARKYSTETGGEV